MKAKKSLGQNFLKSKEILNIIIKTADLKEKDIILEIGPGKGFLTEKILEKVKKAIVVEKDDRLVCLLKEKFKKEVKSGKLKIIHDDVLNLDIKKMGVEYPLKYKVVANIPYYITGQIIRKFLSTKKQPVKMVLMVQKEVAKRIIDKRESLLSISVKVYGDPVYIKTVKSKYFKPQPKVDSAILLINNISKGFFSKINSSKKNIDYEKEFFELIKAGFSHKRKLLINNLKTNYKKTTKISKKELEDVFEKNNINKKSRPENFSKEDWMKILEYFKKYV